MTKMTSVALAGFLAAGMLQAPVAFADSGTTSAGGTSSANAGSSGDKTDTSTQQNQNSADKSKQHR